MPVYYNADKKTWYAMFYAKDYKGVNKKYKKTGFKKKKEAGEQVMQIQTRIFVFLQQLTKLIFYKKT